MAYKAACAGIDLGGGKAVILGDPSRDKSEALLRAYGRYVESLGGRYYTACDVGTDVRDMDVIAKETRFATGRSPEQGGAGDSAVLTAYGVFQAMRAAAQHTWGSPSLEGRRVAVEGVGKVGSHLVEHLLTDGASVLASDVSAAALERVRGLGQVETTDVDDLPTRDCDVYAPCALGGSITDELVPALQAAVVCGAANNQLAHPGLEKALADRGVLFTPDYVANAGGLVQVADEAQHLTSAASASTGPRPRPRRSSTRRCASSSWPTARACRRRWPPTGWPSGGWPKSAACAASSCPVAPEPSGRRVASAVYLYG
jgi:valine dehydrogenase (NAD+)